MTLAALGAEWQREAQIKNRGISRTMENTFILLCLLVVLTFYGYVKNVQNIAKMSDWSLTLSQKSNYF